MARNANSLPLIPGFAWNCQLRSLAKPGLVNKAEALYLADRTSEALESMSEAEALAERFEQRVYCVDLHRLRGRF
jgi:hypothetical protein